MSASAGDYIVISDTNGLSWAVAMDTTGSSPSPTGAIWTAIPAGRKVKVNISAALTAAAVATIVKNALNALTGFSSVITIDDSAANGTMTLTSVAKGPVTDPVPHNENDSGAGSIVGVQTTGGVAAAGTIDLSLETMTITSHGFYTGEKVRLTTTGTLPGGLAVLTDYFIIKIDANNIAFATSLVNANAGTAINLTTSGSGTQTITPTALSAASIKGQRSDDGIAWYDDTDLPSQSITVDSNFMFAKKDCGYAKVRLALTMASGEIDIDAIMASKGE